MDAAAGFTMTSRPLALLWSHGKASDPSHRSRGCDRCLRRAGWRCRGAGAIRTRPYCHHAGGYRRSEAVAAARCRSVAADPRRARERSGRPSSRRPGAPAGGSVTEGLSRSSVGGRRASSLRLRSWKPEARVRVRGGDWRGAHQKRVLLCPSTSISRTSRPTAAGRTRSTRGARAAARPKQVHALSRRVPRLPPDARELRAY